jgi:hypothetical protein
VNVIKECCYTDGYIDLNDEECRGCTTSAKNICKIFSIYNGFRDESYFLDNKRLSGEPAKSDFVDRIRRVKK